MAGLRDELAGAILATARDALAEGADASEIAVALFTAATYWAASIGDPRAVAALAVEIAGDLAALPARGAH